MKQYLASFLVLPGIALLQGTIFAADLKMAHAEEVFVFAARETPVRVQLTNGTQEEENEKIRYRLYQASSATLAPIGEELETETLAFPPNQTVVVEIPVVAPEVRTITLFVLRLFQGEEELGKIPVRVCPGRILQGLEKLSNPVALFEGANTWAQVLDEQGIPMVNAREGGEMERFPGSLLLARVDSREVERAWEDLAGNLPSECSILMIVSPGVTGSEKLAPLKFMKRKGRPVLVVQDWFVHEFESSALSQLRILRAAELLLEHPTR